jgi:hypothetical protein
MAARIPSSWARAPGYGGSRDRHCRRDECRRHHAWARLCRRVPGGSQIFMRFFCMERYLASRFRLQAHISDGGKRYWTIGA